VCRITEYGEFRAEFYEIVVGVHRRREKEASQKRHSIKRSIVHERYSRMNSKNDIWLIQVDPPIEFNRYVSPICFDRSVFPTNTPCYVTGWGKTSPFRDADCKYSTFQDFGVYFSLYTIHESRWTILSITAAHEVRRAGVLTCGSCHLERSA